MESLKPTDEALALFNAVLIDAWKDQKAGHLAELDRLKERIRQLETRKQRIDEQTYKEQSELVRQDLMLRRLEMNELTVDQNDLEACINYCQGFLKSAAKLWASADTNMKQRFQNLIFPKGITFQAGVIGTSEISPIFKIFQQTDGDQSKLAPRAGLEPATWRLTVARSTIELPRKKLRCENRKNHWSYTNLFFV